MQWLLVKDNPSLVQFSSLIKLSGPAILQISNYWNEGDEILINFLPRIDLNEMIKHWKRKTQSRTKKFDRHVANQTSCL